MGASCGEEADLARSLVGLALSCRGRVGSVLFSVVAKVTPLAERAQVRRVAVLRNAIEVGDGKNHLNGVALLSEASRAVDVHPPPAEVVGVPSDEGSVRRPAAARRHVIVPALAGALARILRARSDPRGDRAPVSGVPTDVLGTDGAHRWAAFFGGMGAHDRTTTPSTVGSPHLAHPVRAACVDFPRRCSPSITHASQTRSRVAWS
jgi:hypothetical protein